MMTTECQMCGDIATRDTCPPCFRMRTGAARIIPDMHDLATLTQHLCRIGYAMQTAAAADTAVAAAVTTMTCPARVRNKWPGIRRRHTKVLHHPEQTLLTREDLCAKLGDTVLCSYCHEFPSSGLDRVDSDQGYTVENTIPCCVLCNFTKCDLSLDVFLAQAKKACVKWSATCDAC